MYLRIYALKMAQNALKNNVVHPKTHCKKDQCVQLIGTTVHSACNREPKMA